MTSRSRRAAFTAAAGAAVNEGPTGFLARLASLPRLVLDVATGRYTGISRSRLLLIALAVGYVLSPVDLLPEVLLTVPGLADDALVAGWIVTALLAATAGSQAWRRGESDPGAAATGGGPRVVPGEVLATHPA